MRRVLAIFLISLSAMSYAGAKGGFSRFDNAIKRFLMSGLDTNYIAVSRTSFEVPVVSNIFGMTSVIPLEDGNKLSLDTGSGLELGVGFGYHGLDYIQTFRLNGMKESSSYFSFDFYDNYWGINFTMSDNQYPTKGVGISSFNFNAYYAVFGNRYSYPATFYGNFVQKQSAGSPIVTCWYNHLHLWNLEGKTVIPDTMNIDNGTICGGYGYNWAFRGGKTVLNLSGELGIMIPYWGFAAQARGGAMHWISDNFRLYFSAIGFFGQGKMDDTHALLNSEWRISFGMAYCFGKF